MKFQETGLKCLKVRSWVHFFSLHILMICRHCKCTEVFLFADDTNITAVHCQNESFQADLDIISNWLSDNKLVLNLDKFFKWI